MSKSNMIFLMVLLLLISGTALVRNTVGLKSYTSRLLASTSDYEAFASSVVLNAVAIKKRISRPISNLFPSAPTSDSSRLFEPIQVDYITSLETKDFFPFVVVSFIALLLSALSRSFIPAQLIFTAETLFVAFCVIISTFKLNTPAYHVELETDRNWDLLWGNVLNTVTCPKDFFAQWFLQTTFEEIRREDAHDFLCWAMFASLSKNVNAAQLKSVERALCQIELAAFSKPGSAGEISSATRFPLRSKGELPLRSMRSSIEPLRWIHKPLSLYFVLQVVLGTFNVRYSLFNDGYEHKSAGKLNYWINMNKNAAQHKDKSDSAKSARLPIIFFHGIGGVFSYLKLLGGLTLFGCPVVIVEMPYVSLHVAPNVPSIDDHVGAVEQIMDENGFDGAIIVGHSFGTTVMSWLVQAIPKRIAGAVFLDPVVFMLHLRDISFNWMYGSVTNVGHESANRGVEDIFGIVKTELFAANAVQRHFNWARNILWAHELQEREVETLILVSGGDKVVPSLEVARHIDDHNVQMQSEGKRSYVDSEVFDDAGHGGLVFEEGYRSRALKSIGLIVEKSHVNWFGAKDTEEMIHVVVDAGETVSFAVPISISAAVSKQ